MRAVRAFARRAEACFSTAFSGFGPRAGARRRLLRCGGDRKRSTGSTWRTYANVSTN